MRKALVLIALAAAALGVAFSVGGSGNQDGWGQGNSNAPFGFGQQIAGAWLGVTDSGNGPFEFVMQLSADGNLLMNNTVINDGNNNLTTAVGVWKRTGVRTIAMTALIRIVDPNGDLLFYEKVVGELAIAGDELSGKAEGRVYLPNQDPLDPKEVPVQLLSGPVVGRRICVETLAE